MIFRLGAIFIALSMFATTASSSESGFRVIDNSVGISQVIALNSAGEVVGSKEISESGSLILRTAPYFHDGISEKQIPNLGRYTNMQPQSVSDDGRVVGFAGRAPSDSHGGFQAFLWNSESAELEGLGFLPGHISSCALDVSADTRTVVGFSLGRQPSSMVPCYWERKNGAWNCHSLSTPRRDNSYLQTSRVVISDDGSRIAACVLASNTNGTDGNRPGGDSYYSNHLFMWLRDVTGHFSGKSIEARGFRLAGINNHGVIAATRTIRDRERAFVWEPNRGLRQIDLLPGDVRAHALGLNNRGIVVGYSDDPYGPDGGPRAFIWRRGVVRPLPLPQRALFSVATCITDNGLVGGYLEYEQSSDRSSKTVSFVLNLDLDESSGFFSAIE